MNIIISPAKKMNVRDDQIEMAGLPVFLSDTRQLAAYIKSLDYDQAKELWKCNDQIAALNYERFARMDLEKRLTPALLAYEGIQYQYMAPGVFTRDQWNYVRDHLYILSGFYGILRPEDGVVPYRLEMQARIGLGSGSLYDFWGDRLYREIVKEDRVILNLASKEYSKAIEAYLEPDVVFVTCVFGTLETDKKGKEKIKVKATEAKMARGEMVRYLSEHQIQDVEGVKAFDGLDFRYREDLSSAEQLVFIHK